MSAMVKKKNFPYFGPANSKAIALHKPAHMAQAFPIGGWDLLLLPSNISHAVYQEAPKKSTFQDDQAESGALGTICHDFDPQATTLPGCHMASSPAASLNSPTCLTPNAKPFLL